MTPEVLFYHLKELGVAAGLTDDARNLSLVAPEGALTSEIVDLIREHKSDLIETIYSLDEAEAIAWEGCAKTSGNDESSSGGAVIGHVTLSGDPLLMSFYENDPSVRCLTEQLSKHGGGGELEFVRCAV
jgi:hypothetical protein